MTTRDAPYQPVNPELADVQATPGRVLLDFGTDWCGHCIAARPAVDAWLARHPDVTSLRVEDGRGRPLGRSYRVKLWPTLILLHDGQEITRVVRPVNEQELNVFDEAIG